MPRISTELRSRQNVPEKIPIHRQQQQQQRQRRCSNEPSRTFQDDDEDELIRRVAEKLKFSSNFSDRPEGLHHRERFDDFNGHDKRRNMWAKDQVRAPKGCHKTGNLKY